MEGYWDLNNHSDPIVKDFIRELQGLADLKKHLVYKDSAAVSISLKDGMTGKKLIEYWPLKNKIINTWNDHNVIGISKDLSDRYHKEIANLPDQRVKDPGLFILLLEQMIAELESKRGSR